MDFVCLATLKCSDSRKQGVRSGVGMIVNEHRSDEADTEDGRLNVAKREVVEEHCSNR